MIHQAQPPLPKTLNVGVCIKVIQYVPQQQNEQVRDQRSKFAMSFTNKVPFTLINSRDCHPLPFFSCVSFY